MTTAGNLEIRYQKLKNLNDCFRHHDPELNLQFFWSYFLGRFTLQLYRKICFVFLLRISCHSNVCEKFDFYLTDFRKTIACLRVTHTAQISTNFVVFVEIYLGKRH